INGLGADRIMLGTSCSLLHSPIDLEGERKLDSEVRSWLSFARQKCQELRMLADASSGSTETKALEDNRAAQATRRASPRLRNPAVRERVQDIDADWSRRKASYAERKMRQQERLHLPPLPTTTIGSFPQTPELRSKRQQLKRGAVSVAEYDTAMREYIKD